jgi:hypothetical protein
VRDIWGGSKIEISTKHPKEKNHQWKLLHTFVLATRNSRIPPVLIAEIELGDIGGTAKLHVTTSNRIDKTYYIPSL